MIFILIIGIISKRDILLFTIKIHPKLILDFYLNPNIVKPSEFPLWFMHWLEKIGPKSDVLPKPIFDTFFEWYDYHPRLKGKISKNSPKNQKEIYFFTEFRISHYFILEMGYCV